MDATRLAGARSRLASRMTETVTIGHWTDNTNATGESIRTLTETLYDGPGRVHYANTQAHNSDSGSQVVYDQAVTVSIPVTASIPAGSGVKVTASAADADLVGREYTVQGSVAGQVTARRMQVVELN